MSGLRRIFSKAFSSSRPSVTIAPSQNDDDVVLAENPVPASEETIPAEWKARADAASERLARLLSFGPFADGVLIATNHGPMVTDAEDGSVGSILLHQGSYADHEYELARSLVSPEGRVLVVGAHIGSHVVRLARDCGEVLAIEANPRTFSFLQANINLQRRDNVKAFNIAAGEKDGTIQFLLNRDQSGGSKRKPVHDRFFYSYDNPKIIDIDCKILDDVFFDVKDFDLVFMDIEGSEYFALQGMQKILSRSKALSVEFLVHHLRDVAAVEIDDFSALIVPHFAWMLLPDTGEFVAQANMASRMREMFETGQNYDCVYFLKDLDAAWLRERHLPDPRGGNV